MTDYSSHYSESSFWGKIQKIEGLGKVVRIAMDIYKVLGSSDTPGIVKAVCIAALGYLIFPLDAVPDVIPFLGYGDDFGVLAGAAASMAGYLPSR